MACLVVDKSSNCLCFKKVVVNQTKLNQMSVSLLVMPGHVQSQRGIIRHHSQFQCSNAIYYRYFVDTLNKLTFLLTFYLYI